MRVWALSSDAYLKLDWSAGLLTDEGFYIHNARNIALFGHARTDEFNNMLLAPALHAAQTAVFNLFGTGVVQARAISVVCGLLTLFTLWSAIRRCLGERVALTTVAFLALDHINVLYNRMALLDTPAALGAAGALYAFTRGVERPSSTEADPGNRVRLAWLMVCGLLLGLTVTNRMLAAYMIPAPFVALWSARRPAGSYAAVAVGLAVVVVVYVAAWYWPHRAELSAMNQYYRTNQIQPHSFSHLMDNVRQAFVGDFRGISPYLFRHSPVVYGLALAWIAGVLTSRRPTSADDGRSAMLVYLATWFVLGWAMLAVISYSPSRYYVTLYPAMGALAAVAAWELPGWLRRASVATSVQRLAAAGVLGFGVFHTLLAVVHYRGPLPSWAASLLLTLIAVAMGTALFMGWARLALWLSRNAQRALPAVILLWAGWNSVWLGHWLMTLDYTQVRLSRWLAERLPPGSVLIGDVAPGVTMDNSFRAIHVQPGLVNDERPVEKFAGSPRYVAVLTGRWKEKYWVDNYPELIAPERLVKQARVLRWDVGVYSVDPSQGNP